MMCAEERFSRRPVSRAVRTLDQAWVERHRNRALAGFDKTDRKGTTEIIFYSPNAVINRPQDALLQAARVAIAPNVSWPVGIVLDDDNRPRPTSEGIVAEVES